MTYQHTFDRGTQDRGIQDRGTHDRAAAMRAPAAPRDDVLSSLANAARDNPLSAALIGMGAVWLFTGGGRVPLFGGNGRTSVAGSMASGAGNLAKGAGDLAQGAAQSVGRMGQSLASGASGLIGGVAETVSDAAGRVGERVSGSFNGVDAQSDYRNPAFDGVAPQGLRASMSGMAGSLQDMFERHPVALGAAGLALGAAVAASLPVTAVERDTLGKATDAVREKLGEAADQASDMAAAVAGEVSGELKG